MTAICASCLQLATRGWEANEIFIKKIDEQKKRRAEIDATFPLGSNHHTQQIGPFSVKFDGNSDPRKRKTMRFADCRLNDLG